MKSMVREIRIMSGLNQMEMADWLGVTFATVNRWENGHAEPSKPAQVALFDFCNAHGVPVAEMVFRKIEKRAMDLQEKGRTVLFHGSKNGIKGDIRPASRSQCDFGKGFYMGNDVRQAVCRTAGFNNPKIYIASMDLSNMAQLELQPDINWAMLIAYNRGRMRGYEDTELFRKCCRVLDGIDVVIGSIANDRMYYVLDGFFKGNMTDAVLTACLKTLDLGKQYVALTDKACRAIRLEESITLNVIEQLAIQEESEKVRQEGLSGAEEMFRKYRREGRYFDEILNDEK